MTIALWVSVILTLLGILAGVVKLFVDQKAYLYKLQQDDSAAKHSKVISENELNLKLLELLRTASQKEKEEVSRTDEEFRRGFIDLIKQHNDLMEANQKVLLDGVKLTTDLEHERTKTESLTVRVAALEKLVPELHETIAKHMETIVLRDALIVGLNAQCEALKKELVETSLRSANFNAEASIALRAQERVEGALAEARAELTKG